MGKRVLVTGMSGTGKTAVINELARRGYRAVDLDSPIWSHWVDSSPDDPLTPGVGRDWVWREDRVRELLSDCGEEFLFVSGCAENMAELFDLIDKVILLSAPLETIIGRVSARSGAGYGQQADEQRKIAELVAKIEPLLRQSADIEVDTQQPVDRTVDQILLQVRPAELRRGPSRPERAGEHHDDA